MVCVDHRAGQSGSRTHQHPVVRRVDQYVECDGVRYSMRIHIHTPYFIHLYDTIFEIV